MQVDQIGGALGLALDTGKVLLLDFHDVWTAPHEQGVDFCKGRRSVDTCFFEPISNCTLDHVYGSDFVAEYNRRPNQTALEKQREACSLKGVSFATEYDNKVPDRYTSLMEYPGALSHEFVGGVHRDVYW